MPPITSVSSIASHAITVAAAIEPSAADCLPAERSHQACQPMHACLPCSHGHLKVIEDLVGRDALDAIPTNMPPQLFKCGQPRIIDSVSPLGFSENSLQDHFKRRHGTVPS